MEVYTGLPEFQRVRLGRLSFHHYLDMPAVCLYPGFLQAVAERYWASTEIVLTRVGDFVFSLEDMVTLIGLRMHEEPITGVLHGACYTSEKFTCLLGATPH